MPYEPPPELASLGLAEIAEQVAQRKLPPVEQWHPAEEGDSGMRIAADGSWYHDGGKIRRQAMVRAFAGLLTRDETGAYWLVTPVQRLSIEVEDAAFIATDCRMVEDGIALRLNTDELVIVGPDHALRAEGNRDAPAIYCHVRRGCEGRLNRSTYEQLAQIALARGDDWTVTSQGETYSLLPA
jgi:hypothetical protein